MKTKPTDAELAILVVLWGRGPSTVREVHEAQAHRRTGYTTVLKLLQIMRDKGLVRRDESQRSHVYVAAVDERVAQRHLVRDLVDRVFRGSAASLVLNALSSRASTARELREIRALLDEVETERKGARS